MKLLLSILGGLIICKITGLSQGAIVMAFLAYLIFYPGGLNNDG